MSTPDQQKQRKSLIQAVAAVLEDLNATRAGPHASVQFNVPAPEELARARELVEGASGLEVLQLLRAEQAHFAGRLFGR